MGDSPPPPGPAPAKVFYDGCPGCAIDQRKESHEGVPYKELFFVGITTFASSLPITSLFPFLYFMIRDLHVAQREEDIGFYAGFLGASYMIGRGLASVFWGMVADRIGRKPVIAISLFSVIIFNTLFGLSVKYWMAITTRLLLGALNGFLAPVKAYSIEVCRPEQQALGISIVSTAWGMGVIIGPAIGGYLAQPVKQYPHMFHQKSIFARFPYLLPCLCISIFAAVVFISCAWLPVFSLWTVSNRKYGGLSFSSKDVGQVLTVAGASLLVYQLFVYRWFDKILGPIHSTRVAAALSIPIIAAYPFMTHLTGLRLGVAIYIAAMIKSILAITRVTGTSLLQNNAVPQEQRGAANGIATTAMSLFKAAAPACAGVIFSWAQKRQHAAFFPGDQMVFLLLNLTELIGLILTFKPFLAVPPQYK